MLSFPCDLSIRENQKCESDTTIILDIIIFKYKFCAGGVIEYNEYRKMGKVSTRGQISDMNQSSYFNERK